MSRIGKISGRNWDEAPIGATHVNRSLHSRHPWYKVEGDIVYHHNSIDGWYYSERSDNITHISKEEDFGFTHWSYTYEGPYTPFAPIETEEDKKLEALKATIEQAQKQIDEIVRNAK